MTEKEMDQVFKQTSLEYKNKRPKVYYKIRNYVWFVNVFIAAINATEAYLMFQHMTALTYFALLVTVLADITWYRNHVYSVFRHMMSQECERVLKTTERRIKEQMKHEKNQ